MKQPLLTRMRTFCKQTPHLMLAVSLFASLVATNVGSLVSAASVQNLKATPRVSFTFDDGLASAVTLAAPTLATYGLTGTNYIITDCVGMTTVPNTCAADQNSSYMTWDQIAQLKGFGWEIGSHTKSHIQLSTDKPTAAALTSQLKDSQSALAAHGYAATDLAFPYGDYDTNVLAQTAKYYESARGFADLGYNTWPYDNTLIVNEQVQEGTAVGNIKGVTYAQVKAYIDAAITNNQWLVLTFHGITSTTPTKADDYHTSTGLLGQIAQYVQQQQTAGKIKAVNIEDGLVRGTNLLANGDFSQGIAAGWTTDDATNIKADNANNGRYPDPTHSISVKTPAGNTVDKHLFSPTISVSSTDSYILKTYVNLLSGGGEIDFFVDEYDANGTYISGQYFNGMAYSTAANPINTRDISFKYTPTSATVAKARLQIIAHGASVNGYVDGAQWMSVNETLPPAGDTVPPVISGISASSLVSTTATVNWSTNEGATSKVEYGLTTAYGSTTTEDSALVTTHTVSLSGLTAATTYHYRVISKDAAGNTTTSADMTFTTAAGTVPTGKTGDVNGDGSIDALDLSTVLTNWGKPSMTKAQGDLNGDGAVDALDLSTVLTNWGK